MNKDKKENFPGDISMEEQEEKEKKAWDIPDIDETEQSEILEETEEPESTKSAEEAIEKQKKEIAELDNKYVRLYAEFENYKRIVAKEKSELIKYSNEELLKELLSVIDHLELALKHSSTSTDKAVSALVEGVELTLKELKGTLEKFGLVGIEALGKPFDPSVHHAMAQIESEDAEENTVVAEFRKGYMLKERVLRPAYVGVSKQSSGGDEGKEKKDIEAAEDIKEKKEAENKNKKKGKKIEIEEE
jgi:molecular chaperone GrpE